MNTKKFWLSSLMALVVLWMNTAWAIAYPAEPVDETANTAAVPCAAILENSGRLLARMDIPSRYPDYVTLERVENCLRGGATTAIPVTSGSLDAGEQRYEDFKLRQAEEMGK